MFTNHTSEFWNNRYSQQEYSYGTEPNQFLAKQQHRLRPGMNALVIGDGEGRNGVWLATQGLTVLSVDLSKVGLEKAQALATQKGVSIQAKCVDVTDWDWPVAKYDVVVVIYVNFSKDVRSLVHRAILKALKPGGIVILEAFSKNQLHYKETYNSGGPQKEEMLYNTALLQEDFVEGNVIELLETTTILKEGAYHDGKASVVRLIASAQ